MLVGLLLAGNLSGFGSSGVAPPTAAIEWGVGSPFHRKRKPKDEEELVAEVERFAESELAVLPQPQQKRARTQLFRLAKQVPVAATATPDIAALAQDVVRQWIKQRAEEEDTLTVLLLF